MDKFIYLSTFIYYIRGMDTHTSWGNTPNKLTYDITSMAENRVRVIVNIKDIELGVLYFERPKMGWLRKPIMPTKWVCVDAKIEGLYTYGGNDITPKEIVALCQELIEERGY